MNQCRRLTSDELAALLAQGWTVVGGPFITEGECLNSCGGSSSSSGSGSGSGSGSSSGGISTACCPSNLIPATLYATFTDNGSCACLNGVTVQMTYSGGAWSGSTTACSGTLTVSFVCLGGSFWGLQVSCGVGSAFPSGPDFTCSPFQWQYTTGFSADTCCPGGSANVVVTP